MLQSKRKNTCIFVILTVVMAIALALPLAGCGRQRKAADPASADPTHTDAIGSMESTAIPGEENSSQTWKGTPVASEVIWIPGEPYGYNVNSVIGNSDSGRNIHSFKKNQWIVMCLNDKTLQISDYSGRLIGEYEDVRNFAMNDFAAVEKYGKWGLIDAEGQVVLPIVYNDIDYYDGRVMVASENKYGGSPWKWGFLDLETQIVTYMDGDYLSSGYSEGLAVVCIDGKYGYVDATGQLVIPAKYEVASPFSEGLAAVCENLPLDFA